MPIASYFAVTDDGGVVLDLKRDQVLKLNATASEMWSLLAAGVPQAKVITEIAAKYAVDPLRVSQDLQSLVSKSLALGLCPRSVIIAGSPSASAVTSQSSSAVVLTTHESSSAIRVVRALVALALFDIILTLRNLESLCTIVRSLAVKKESSIPQSVAVSRVLAAVERASVWYPKKSLCLQRSAVTTCLLRRDGIPAKMAVGIRSMPFLAHAWVELEGKVINDSSRVKGFYQSIAVY